MYAQYTLTHAHHIGCKLVAYVYICLEIPEILQETFSNKKEDCFRLFSIVCEDHSIRTHKAS